jgi:putative membrane protein
MPGKNTLTAAPEVDRPPAASDGTLAVSPPPVSRRTAALLALGVLAIAALVYHVGVGEVVTLLAALGWRAPLVVAPFAIISLVDSLALARALSRHGRRRLSLWRVYWIRQAGEAVSNLTPTAGLGGEPVKAYLLRRNGVEAGDGVAAVVIAKTAIVCSQFVFTLLGLLLFLDRLGVLRDRAPMLLGAALVALAVSAVLVFGQRRGLAAATVRLLDRIGARFQFVRRLERQAAAIDHALVRFYRDDPRGFVLTTAYHMIGWLLGAGEVMFLFYLMGVACDWRQAIIIESLTQATMAAAAFSPGGLGVQEISGTILCRLVGIGEAPGAALMLLKRARELVFTAVGASLISWLARGK